MSVLGAWVSPTPSLNKIIALMALIIALIGIHVWDRGRAIEKAEQAVHYSYQLENAKATQKAKEEKAQLVLEQTIAIGERDDKIKALGIELAAAVKRMRERPSRSQESREPSEVRSSCTGRELFQEDGEFLIREAARADKVREERDFYYGEYERVRLMIERINNE